MSEALTSDHESDANLGYLFRLAHQRFRATLEDALQGLELSAQEYVILSVFETRPELSTSELARITQVTRQTMHTAVLGLETAGLLADDGVAQLRFLRCLVRWRHDAFVGDVGPGSLVLVHGRGPTRDQRPGHVTWRPCRSAKT